MSEPDASGSDVVDSGTGGSSGMGGAAAHGGSAAGAGGMNGVGGTGGALGDASMVHGDAGIVQGDAGMLHGDAGRTRDAAADDTKDTGSRDATAGTGCDGTVRAPSVEGYAEQVTGGGDGDVVTASTGTEIHAAICNRPTDDTPRTILIDGTITPGNTLEQDGSCNTADGLIELKEISNISLIGVGTNGVLDQVGIHIRTASNIIIQNLTIKNVRKSNTSTPSNGGDAIGMESQVDRIWIDHNEIHGSTTEGEEHDGLIDMKNHTTNVTISYNHLHDSGRGGLIGPSDDGDDGSTRITFHHNWYENINSRTHLIREARAHLYNNYYEDILSTGINCRNGASLRIEGNYFINAKNPLGTFYYLENPGTYEVLENYFAPSVVWEADDDEVPAGPDVQSTGSVSVPYDYALDPVECVPEIVKANAGVGKL